MEWLINVDFWGVVHGARAFLRSVGTSRGAHREPLVDLRHHRPARPDRLLRGEIRGARLFEGLRHELPMAGSPVRLSWCIPAASPPTSPATPASAPASPTTPAAPQSIERFDAVAKTTPTAAAQRITRHREEPAAHPDRQRCALHGPAAAVSAPRHTGRCWRADREDGRRRGSRCRRNAAPWRGEVAPRRIYGGSGERPFAAGLEDEEKPSPTAILRRSPTLRGLSQDEVGVGQAGV